MRQTRPELIVPIRDRRQRRRIVTLRNFMWLALSAFVLFGAISVASELRYRKPGGESYGRLYERQVAKARPAVAQSPNVVTEARPVPEAERPDPMLLAPAAREQYLGVQPTTKASVAVVPTDDGFTRPEPLLRAGQQGRVAIVGGPEGVAVLRDEQGKRKTLSGGLFRE